MSFVEKFLVTNLKLADFFSSFELEVFFLNFLLMFFSLLSTFGGKSFQANGLKTLKRVICLASGFRLSHFLSLSISVSLFLFYIPIFYSFLMSHDFYYPLFFITLLPHLSLHFQLFPSLSYIASILHYYPFFKSSLTLACFLPLSDQY